MSLVPVDGAPAGEGAALRAALALSAATGQGFEMTRIGERRGVPGLTASQLAVVRAVALACGAKVGGAFDRSPDLRFEPGPVEAGQFRHDLAGPEPAMLLLQTVLVPLATASEPSRVELQGGTHVPGSPSAHYVLRHWAAIVGRLGLHAGIELRRAGFAPPGDGEVHARVAPWSRPAPELRLDRRGELVALRGLSLAGRQRGDLAERQAEAVRRELWERRRIEAEWEVGTMPATSPGSLLMFELEFASSRAAFAAVGERRVRPDVLAARLVRQVLAFLDRDAAVDSHLPSQIAVPLAVGRGGGVVSTAELTPHLERVVGVLNLFGCPARLDGRVGGPGHLEVSAW